MAESQANDVRADALQLINALPAGATWDDVMYRVYVRQCIESGICDADADRILPVESVRQKFGLSP